MIQWQDTGFVLFQKRQGETTFLTSVLTENHGRCVAISYGRKLPADIMSLVQVSYQAKTENQLGHIKMETVRPYSHLYLDDRKRLQLLLMMGYLLNKSLPENEIESEIYQNTLDFVQGLENDSYLQQYLIWELSLLETLGFAPDWKGRDIIPFYVSPRTGHAVSEEEGFPWKDRLFKIPSFLWQKRTDIPLKEDDLKDGFMLMEWFLEHHLLDEKIPFLRHTLWD